MAKVPETILKKTLGSLPSEGFFSCRYPCCHPLAENIVQGGASFMAFPPFPLETREHSVWTYLQHFLLGWPGCPV